MDPRGNIYSAPESEIPAEDSKRLVDFLEAEASNPNEEAARRRLEVLAEREARLARDEALAMGGATKFPSMPAPLRFDVLREQNVSRKTRWHGEADEWTGADWSNAMAGECGEACNIIKKLRRHETHTGTSYNTPEVAELLPALAEELADVVTYCDLLAHKYDIDLGQAVREKFNKVSAAQDFPERL